MRIESKNREEWLAQRRGVLTATEIAKCVHSPSEAEKLRLEKASGKQAFRGNKYTSHGHSREPVIADWLTQQPGMESLYPNDDMWVSEEDSRIAATPDLVDFTGDRVGEIKTVKQDIEWFGIDDIPRQYYDQIQIQLYVVGADECAFAWEPYGETADGLKPVSDPKYGVVKRDEERIKELLEWANSWFEKLEETPPDISELLKQYLAEEKVAKEAAEQRDKTKALLREAMGEKPQAWTYDGLARVSISEPTKRKTFDSARFKKDNPDLAKEYMKETTNNGSMRITAIEESEG